MIDAYNSFAQQFGPSSQANAMQGMIDNVMAAHSQESQSRVLQANAERQRQHEKEMEAMRLEALIGRLQSEGQPYHRRSSAGGAWQTFNPSTLDYDYADRVMIR